MIEVKIVLFVVVGYETRASQCLCGISTAKSHRVADRYRSQSQHRPVGFR
jgi:hypothetical protein